MEGWRTVYSPPQPTVDAIPDLLQWDNGQLFYRRNATPYPGLLVIPDKGGPAVAVSGFPSVAPRTMRFEGPDVLYVPYDVSSASLPMLSLPRSGGTASAVTEVVAFKNEPDVEVGPFAIAEDAIYAVYARPDDGVGVWRKNRRTGVEADLGSRLPGPRSDYLFQQVTLTPDWVFLAGIRHVAFPRTGGPAIPLRPFTVSAGYLAASLRGTVLWRGSPGEQTTDSTLTQLAISKMGFDGPARPLPQSLPQSALPIGASDDTRNGFFITALELLEDGFRHVTVWHLDDAGALQRLACDPEVGRYIEHTTVSPEGFFLAPAFEELGYHTEIVFVHGP